MWVRFLALVATLFVAEAAPKCVQNDQKPHLVNETSGKPSLLLFFFLRLRIRFFSALSNFFVMDIVSRLCIHFSSKLLNEQFIRCRHSRGAGKLLIYTRSYCVYAFVFN